MAQINKVNVSDTTYDISQSPDATFTATSNDNASPTSWTDVAVLASGETNSSIFSKISSMFKNIRFLYSKLGTSDFSSAGDTVSAALAALESGKSDTDHTHTAATTAAAGFMPALNGNSDTCLLGDGTWGTAGSTYANVSTAAPGLAPTLSGTATQYLNGNGGWTTPPDNNTTYANFGSGSAGLVPAPTATQATTGYVLTGAGWQAGTKYNTDTNTTYSFSNTGPTLAWNTQSTVGTVGGVALTVKMPANPNTNTTYANFTSAAAGLVPAAKSGSTNIATSAYVLTGAGWAAGTKYNTDTNTTYGTNVGCYGTLSGTTLVLNTRNFRV
jgi:hypothetical protein